jgi:hypothetical protein
MSVTGKKLFQSGGGGGYTTDGLILDLNANDGSYSSSSTQWADASGSSYNFNRSGSNVSWQNEAATGVGSWYFNGGYFNFAPPSGGNNGLGHFDKSSFSIEIWLKYVPYGIQSTPWLWGYDYTSHSPPYYKQYLRIYDYANTAIGGYNSASYATGLSGNNWYQVVSTRNNSTLRGQMFVNGQEVGITDNANRVLQGSPYGYSQEVYIGRSNYGSGFSYYSSWYKGWMSLVRFYNKALTNAEVATNYEFSKAAHGLT